MSSGRPAARLAAAAPGIPSLDRFRRAPGPPRFQGLSSSLQNHLQNISRSDIQIADHADCHRSCRGVRATGQAWFGEARDPMRQVEYRKRIIRRLRPVLGMRRVPPSPPKRPVAQRAREPRSRISPPSRVQLALWLAREVLAKLVSAQILRGLLPPQASGASAKSRKPPELLRPRDRPWAWPRRPD